MRKLKIEKDGNVSLSIEHKEGIPITFHKSMDLLIRSIMMMMMIITIIITILKFYT